MFSVSSRVSRPSPLEGQEVARARRSVSFSAWVSSAVVKYSKIHAPVAHLHGVPLLLRVPDGADHPLLGLEEVVEPVRTGRPIRRQEHRRTGTGRRTRC